MVSNDSWSAAVLDALHGYQQQGFLCDYTLTSSDGVAFGVHGCVLAAASPPFYETLCNCEDSKVMELNCSTHGLQALVMYLYTGVLDVQSCDEAEVDRLMSLLKLPPLASSDQEVGQNILDGANAKGTHISQDSGCNDAQAANEVFVDKTGTILCQVRTDPDALEVHVFNPESTADDQQSVAWPLPDAKTMGVDAIPQTGIFADVTAPMSSVLADSDAVVALVDIISEELFNLATALETFVPRFNCCSVISMP